MASIKKCLLLNFDEGSNSPSHEYKKMVDKNYLELTQLLPQDRLEEVEIMMLHNGRRVDGRRAAEIFRDNSRFCDITDIIVDISSLPRSIYFPIIIRILDVIREERTTVGEKRNLHVIVAQNTEIDRNIYEKELDEKASYIFSLSGKMLLSAANFQPVIWFPVLGEGKAEQLERIRDLLTSNRSFTDIEVCPVIPFPAKNPRKPDIMIAEYYQVLLDNSEVESRNIIYADESNPFDVYQQIREAGILYDDSLKCLEGCVKVVSALSGKLLSLGALLAAYEGDMAVAYVGAQGYGIRGCIENNNEVELYEVWIEGEPYE